MADDRTQPSQPRPYLLRAMHEWMVDNGLTPHVVVDATHDGAEIPNEYVQDGKLILNVSYEATQDLVLGNEFVEFEARFSGRSRRLHLPVGAILGIYARETGQGMAFSDEDAASKQAASKDTTTGDAPPAPGRGKGPTLKIIK
jgi:stringent starvation protein B